MKLLGISPGNMIGISAKKGDEPYAGMVPCMAFSQAIVMWKTKETNGTVERGRDRVLSE